MTLTPLCPIKFGCAASNKPPQSIDWLCEGDNCAWWSRGGERCAIVTIGMGFWAILDCMKDKQPKRARIKQ